MYDSYFNSLFDALFNETFTTEYKDFKPPRVLKSITASAIPNSNITVNEKTKVMRIVVALPGYTKEDVSLTRDDDFIVLTLAKKEEDGDWIYIQRGFVDNSDDFKAKWKVNTKVYDLDNVNVSLENGLMTIDINPLEEQKPRRATLFGELSE